MRNTVILRLSQQPAQDQHDLRQVTGTRIQAMLPLHVPTRHFTLELNAAAYPCGLDVAYLAVIPDAAASGNLKKIRTDRQQEVDGFCYSHVSIIQPCS